MKKILAFLFLLISFTTVQAANIDQIVYLGDSLTDNGNLYKLFLHFLPKSPPYFNGRFSNGPTWAEDLSAYYSDKYNIDSQNYALGGATAIFHMPSPKVFSPTTLELEVDKYLIDSLFSDRSRSLFAIWIGSNDYIFDQEANPETATKKVVAKIESAIRTLAYYGGKNFLILNLPDISRTPMFQLNSTQQKKMYKLISKHNQKLDESLKRIKDSNPDIKLSFINIYELFNDVIDNPEKYNQKYHVNITNTSDACWQGGYWLRNQLANASLNDEIRQTLITKSDLPKDFDPQNMSNFILQSPELSYVYKMGKAYDAGDLPCSNAGEYIFWDSIHPTAIVHQLLSQVAIETIDSQMLR